MKRVYIEPGWRVHSYYKTLALNPPEGYEFVLGGSPLDRWSNDPGGDCRAESKGHFKFFRSLNHFFDVVRGSRLCSWAQLELLERAMPLNLVKSYLERGLRPPQGTALTFAVNHLVLRREPWILEAEHVAFCLSNRGEWLKSARLRRFLERKLSSPWCRRIVSFVEAAQNNILKYLNCEEFGNKFALVPLAIPVKPFHKGRRDDAQVRLLYVGTTSQPGMFLLKGGLETLECFRILRQRYSHLQMTVRSDVPAEIRQRYDGLPGLRILDSPISAEALEAEYSSADVFLSPLRYATPWSSILEAMSYELPVVAFDAFGTRELVRDGETGLLVPLPDAGKRGPHHDVMEGLVEKVSTLVQDASLRDRMGKEGRREVEEGGHSISYRNKKLTRVLDEATADFPIPGP